VQALETMGNLLNKAETQDEALKWYRQAVKLDSQDFLVLYHYASLALRAPGGSDDKEIETDLRQAIKLNPRFAASYDLLAEYYARRHENLDEAHMLNVTAVQLEPGNVYFRVNSANVLLAADRYTDALTVLDGALKMARNPQETSMVQNSITQVQSFEAERARIEAENKAMNAEAKTVKMVTYVDEMPKLKHPTMPAGGPKNTADGVIKSVACTPPAALEFRLESKGKALVLYMNDYFKLDLSVLNFTPSGSMNPCSDFEGMKAKVEYTDSSDTTVNGQIISVELRK
jgi:tetratricopeptide (TPR) repeat protein